MIQIEFDVMIGGQTRRVKVGPPTQVAFEREFGRSLAGLGTDPRMTDLYWLAWHALAREDKTVGDFDQFLERIETVEAVEESAPGPLAGTA